MLLTPKIDGSRIVTNIDGAGAWKAGLDISAKSDWWRRVAAGEETFYADYSLGIDIPLSIAVLPALVNLLPLAWLTDTVIEVNELDAHFAAALPFIKMRYQKMYPEFEWKGGVEAKNLRVEHIGQAVGNPISLFSGGVDAVFTALANLALKPTLTTIWGADMFFHDRDGWARVEAMNKAFADRLGLEFIAVKSTFRTHLEYGYLDKTFGKPIKDNWWHGYQFGPALSAISLPLAFSQKADTVFLASDYSKKDPYIGRSASDAALVQEFRAGGASVKCHDFNVSRQDKVRFICEFSRNNPDIEIPLRVCWQSSSGVNCGKCEKCMRTQFAIMGCNSSPSDFGFDMSDTKQDEIIEVIASGKIVKTAFWREIVSDLRASKFAGHPIAKALLNAPA